MSRVICRHRCIQAIVYAVLAASVWLKPAQAQFSDVWSAEKLQAGQITNLFARWSGSESIDGVFVSLPVGWTLKDAHILRYGFDEVPVQFSREIESGKYIISTSRGIAGPHELVIRVETGSMTGYGDWSLTPFVRKKDGMQSFIVFRDAYFVARAVRIQPAESVPDNRVLICDEAEGGPLLLRGDVLPNLSLRAAYTLEYWMKTTQLNEVVFSTWDGDENAAYPLELVIDPSGRLTFYCGQPGRHEFLTSNIPIADGNWHHVALTNTPERQQISLFIDGLRTDSLCHSVLALPRRFSLVAVGDRIPSRLSSTTDTFGPYTGLLDELTFYTGTRSEITIRQTMRQKVGPSMEEGVHIGFDEDISDRIVERRSPRMRFVQSDLGFYQPIQHLSAIVETPNVRISWDAPDEQVMAFIVERSTDGKEFIDIGRMEAHASDIQNDYQFLDATAMDQVLYYRICQLFPDGTEHLSGMIKLGLGQEEVRRVKLIGNFPNPFNTTTTITYEVLESETVRLSIWDLSGQPITVLVNSVKDPGIYEASFDASDLPSGTYFIQLQTSEGLESSKMILMK